MLITCKTCGMQMGSSVRTCIKCKQTIVYNEQEREYFIVDALETLRQEGASQSQVEQCLMRDFGLSDEDAKTRATVLFQSGRSVSRRKGIGMIFLGVLILPVGLPVLFMPWPRILFVATPCGAVMILMGIVKTFTGWRITSDG